MFAFRSATLKRFENVNGAISPLLVNPMLIRRHLTPSSHVIKRSITTNMPRFTPNSVDMSPNGWNSRSTPFSKSFRASFSTTQGNDTTGFTAVPSGLRYKDLVAGAGSLRKRGENVVVHYTGWLKSFESNETFDCSYSRNEPVPFDFTTGNINEGWDDVLTGMQVGGKRSVIIPAGYGMNKSKTTSKGDDGAAAAGEVTNADLYFHLELLHIGNIPSTATSTTTAATTAANNNGTAGETKVKDEDDGFLPMEGEGVTYRDARIGTGGTVFRDTLFHIEFSAWEGGFDQGQPVLSSKMENQPYKPEDFKELVQGMKVGGIREIINPATEDVPALYFRIQLMSLIRNVKSKGRVASKVRSTEDLAQG